MKKLLVAMAIGAALAYLFDPDDGSRRRDAVRTKLEGTGLGGRSASSSSSSKAPQPAVRSTPTLSADNGAAAPSVASIP